MTLEQAIRGSRQSCFIPSKFLLLVLPVSSRHFWSSNKRIGAQVAPVAPVAPVSFRRPFNFH
jgi:hypothetical protein